MSEETDPLAQPIASAPVTPLSTGNPFEQKRLRSLRRRVIIGVIASVVIILIAWIVVVQSNRGGILILEPSDNFTVTLNGAPATLHKQSDGVLVNTRPGVYRLRLTRTDYDPYVADITVKKGEIVKLRPVFSVLPQNAVTQDGTVSFVRPSLDGQAVFYFAGSSQTIYRLELKDQVQVPITNAPLAGVKDIQWSTNTDVALVTQTDGLYLQEIPVTDFANQVHVRIAGSEVTSAVWDPTNSERLAFVYAPGTGEHSLAFADKRITTIDHKADISAIPNPRLVWSPNANYILLIGGSDDPTRNNLWIYRTTDGVLTQVTTSGYINNASFAPDSATILYEVAANDPGNPAGALLHAMKPDGNPASNLSVPGTVALAAWKDSASFYYPDVANDSLQLTTLSGDTKTLPFSPPNETIKGMYYFATGQTLIFYTQHSIYLSDLAK